MISKAISPFHVLTRMVSKVISLSLYFVFLRSPRGHPIGAQRPVGTQTLLAKSSVLYLRARDRHTLPPTLRFSPPALARRDTVPHSHRRYSSSTIRYTRILLVAFPRSVSNQFHNTWHLQPFGSRFRMTANAFSLLFMPARSAPVHSTQ